MSRARGRAAEPPPPRRDLLVRRQRHQRPRDPRGGAGGAPSRAAENDPADGSRRRPARRPTAARAAALPLSARSEAALRGQAERLAAHLRAEPDLDPADVAFSLTTTRAAFDHRAVVLGGDRERLLAGLDALAADEPPPDVHEGRARTTRTAFLFSGQGAQRPGMGTGLAAAFPVFAEAFEQACAALEEQLGCPLAEIVAAPEGSDRAALLDRTEITQAALFAHEVSLFRLLESLGPRPDFLIGHSIGELAAAHVGGRSLAGGRRGPGGGTGEADGGPARGRGDVGGGGPGDRDRRSPGWRRPSPPSTRPRPLVLSGEAAEIDRLEAEWRERGRPVSRLRVSHAFHSPLMDPMLAEFRQWPPGSTFGRPPFRSSPTSPASRLARRWPTLSTGSVTCAEPVRLADGVATLAEAGVGRFLELGPDAALGAPVAETLEDLTAHTRDPLVACAQRSGQDQAEALLSFLARAHADGAEVDWAALHQDRGARTVRLPTYAFQRERYWLAPRKSAGDLRAAGLEDAGHPMLGAVVGLAGEDGSLFTGSLSLATHPWLADHAVFDVVLLPGTGFVELALNAGARVGCELLEELTLEAPLVLPEEGVVRLQVTVGEPGEESGTRPVRIFSRLDGVAAPGEAPADWVRHANGVLAPAPDAAPAVEGLDGPWPPAGAEPTDVGPLYGRLAQLGFGYGPAFQGVRAAWRRGDEVFAEVALDGDEARRAGDFGIHPALLDAVFHPVIGSVGDDLEADRLPLPFLWSGVRLARGGVGSLRVRVAPEGDEAMRIDAVDATGAPILSIASLLPREVELAQLEGASRAPADPLYGLSWSEVALPVGEPGAVAILGDLDPPGIEAERHPDLASLVAAIDSGDTPEVVLVAALDLPGGAKGSGGADRVAVDHHDDAAAAHSRVATMLAFLQNWLAEERLLDTLLVVLTEGAVAVDPAESPDPVAAAVRGLVRSAQAEHPGRLGLIDHDGSVSPAALAAAAEPELALREGKAYAPYLARLAGAAAETPPLGADGTVRPAKPPAFDPDGTVLITGATGAIGSRVARHFADHHGARHLLLLSRRGADAPGAPDLLADLADSGCAATVVACDAADRDALAAAIAAIPPAYPLTAVIHVAGVLEDATIEKLDPEQLDRVMRPKVDAALNLDQLTRDSGLAEFVLFSSAAPLLGGAGQGNYAAANAFVDALAARRRAEGLPAVSVAWGLWGVESEIAGQLDVAAIERFAEAVRARMAILPIEPDRSLALLDQARAGTDALVAPLRLDARTMRDLAERQALPLLLRKLVRRPARRDRGNEGALARQLAAAPPAERLAVALAAVRAELAAVLGYDSPAAVDPERSLYELGIDSLSAVELRNRLSHATAVRLPASVIFGAPEPAALAQQICDLVAEHGAASAPGVGSATASSLDPPAGTLATLLRAAHSRGAVIDAVPMLVEAAKLAPAFAAAADLPEPPRLERLAQGDQGGEQDGDQPEKLICVPSFMPGSGPHQFARLARAIAPHRGVLALALPGFRPVEPLPETWAAGIDALARAVMPLAEEGPFALAGYSGGGTLAYALAERCREAGLDPTAVVFIDTHMSSAEAARRATLAAVLGQMIEHPSELIALDDVNLLAMAAYLRLMDEWEPVPLAVRSLRLTAAADLGEATGGPIPDWQASADLVETPGDHFSMIERDAPTTAGALLEWLAATADLTPR